MDAPELDDLVAYERGSFELEEFGGFLHLAFKILYQLCHLVRRNLSNYSRFRLRMILALFLRDRSHAISDITNLFDDAARRDSMFLVVGNLNRAPAVRLVDGSSHRVRDRRPRT